MTKGRSTCIYLCFSALGLHAARGLSLAVASRSSCSLRSTGLRVCRLRSCSVQAQLNHGTWNLPGPEI